MNSLSERIAQSRHKGPCEECGAYTELFLGKRVCDACVEAKSDRDRKEKRVTRLRDLVAQGMIKTDTQYAWTRFDWPTDKHNLAAVQTVLYTTKNVWLWGPIGVGKSHLARVKLVRAVAEGAHDVAEVTAHRVVKVATLFNEGLGQFEAWKRASVLLLDDIDKVSWRREQLSILWELFDDRASNNKQTLVTSNVKIGAFHSWLRDICADNHAVATGTIDRLKPLERVELKGKNRR